MRDGQQRKMPFLPGGVLRSLRFCLEEGAGTRNYLVMSAASDFSAAKPVTVGELGLVFLLDTVAREKVI